MDRQIFEKRVCTKQQGNSGKNSFGTYSIRVSAGTRGMDSRPWYMHLTCLFWQMHLLGHSPCPPTIMICRSRTTISPSFHGSIMVHRRWECRMLNSLVQTTDDLTGRCFNDRIVGVNRLIPRRGRVEFAQFYDSEYNNSPTTTITETKKVEIK